MDFCGVLLNSYIAAGVGKHRRFLYLLPDNRSCDEVPKIYEKGIYPRRTGAMVKTEKFSQNVNFSPPDWTGEGIYDMLHVNK